MAKEIIRLDGIRKTFSGGVVAVDHLDLCINEGEFVTLVGPSGCGKTTTLRMIAGFEAPDTGKVFLDGEDVTQFPPYRRQVNTVFQDYALFPHMTIARNVGYGLQVSGASKKQISDVVEESLTLVGLMEKADSFPGQLSGGQRQRVALARALSKKPRVLLLDEPLSALDANLREAMQVELKHLHQKLGLTFVLVTHDQTEALVLSDRVVVMSKGRAEQVAPPASLYDHPATAYVANFIGTSNMMPAKAVEVTATQARVELDGLILCAPNPGFPLEEGSPVTICVRPEKAQLLLNGNQPPADNCIPVTVKESLFMGSWARTTVTLPSGGEFMVDVLNEFLTSKAVLPQPGTEAILTIEPDNLLIFAGTEGHHEA